MMPSQLKIDATQQDFESAEEWNPYRCVIAQTLKRSYPHLDRPHVTAHWISVTDPESAIRYYFATPDQARDYILLFDHGVDTALKPFVLQTKISHQKQMKRLDDQEKRRVSSAQQARSERQSGETKQQKQARKKRNTEKMKKARRGYATE